MNWHKYELENIVLKTTDPIRLWESEIGFIQLDKDSLVVPIQTCDKRAGYVIDGSGKLVLDAIVETERGAVGQPVEKELKSPFIDLGDPEPIQAHLTEVDSKDLTQKGCGGKDEFVSKAQIVLNDNLNRGTRHMGCCSHHRMGQLFIFPNKDGESDVLLVKGSRTVYHTLDTTFVSGSRERVLTSPKEVIVSRHGKAFTFKH